MTNPSTSWEDVARVRQRRIEKLERELAEAQVEIKQWKLREQQWLREVALVEDELAEAQRNAARYR